VKLTLISREKTHYTSNLFHAQYAILEIAQILSENFADAMDNKRVSLGAGV
jgi:hypothetical protein